MKKIALILLALVALTACDNRKCLEGHYNYIPVVQQNCIYNGKTTTCTPYTTILPVWFCDKYEEGSQ
jgi:uncharacterized lipoprotein YajG